MDASGNRITEQHRSEESKNEPLKICAVCGDHRNDFVSPKVTDLTKKNSVLK